MEMKQEALFEINTMTNETKRKVARLLSSYRSLSSVIAAMALDMPTQAVTVNYTPSESQRTNAPTSKTEAIIIAKERLEEKKRIKQKLDIIYDGLDERGKKIWEMHFVLGRFDEIVADELNVSKRQYYREKDRLIRQVAEVFYWM